MLLLLFIGLAFIAQARAEENTPQPQAAPVIKGDFTGLKHTSTGRVDTIIDYQTVLLTDGKIVRLLGLYYAEGEAQYMGKALLETLLPKGTEVMLYQRKNSVSGDKTGKVNRMGHVLAHLVKKQNEEWINGVVVISGLAYAFTDAGNPGMAEQLYAFENNARKNKRGVWKDGSVEGLLTPDTAVKGDGQFRVVEGTVKKAASSKNNLYLNFGDDMKKDFTVMMSPSLRKKLSMRGVDPMGLSGKPIRVRGWIRLWNGPFMELDTAERLEILSPLPSTGPSTGVSTESSTGAVEKPVVAPVSGQTNP